jgi:hypothetical protein
LFDHAAADNALDGMLSDTPLFPAPPKADAKVEIACDVCCPNCAFSSGPISEFATKAALHPSRTAAAHSPAG